MALVHELFCDVCGKTTMHNWGLCQQCVAKAEAAAKEAFFAERRKLTLEQRIEALEEAVFRAKCEGPDI